MSYGSDSNSEDVLPDVLAGAWSTCHRLHSESTSGLGSCTSTQRHKCNPDRQPRSSDILFGKSIKQTDLCNCRRPCTDRRLGLHRSACNIPRYWAPTGCYPLQPLYGLLYAGEAWNSWSNGPWAQSPQSAWSEVIVYLLRISSGNSTFWIFKCPAIKAVNESAMTQ